MCPELIEQNVTFFFYFNLLSVNQCLKISYLASLWLFYIAVKPLCFLLLIQKVKRIKAL